MVTCAFPAHVWISFPKPIKTPNTKYMEWFSFEAGPSVSEWPFFCRQNDFPLKASSFLLENWGQSPLPLVKYYQTTIITSCTITKLKIMNWFSVLYTKCRVLCNSSKEKKKKKKRRLFGAWIDWVSLCITIGMSFSILLLIWARYSRLSVKETPLAKTFEKKNAFKNIDNYLLQRKKK